MDPGGWQIFFFYDGLVVKEDLFYRLMKKIIDEKLATLDAEFIDIPKKTITQINNTNSPNQPEIKNLYDYKLANFTYDNEGIQKAVTNLHETEKNRNTLVIFIVARIPDHLVKMKQIVFYGRAEFLVLDNGNLLDRDKANGTVISRGNDEIEQTLEFVEKSILILSKKFKVNIDIKEFTSDVLPLKSNIQPVSPARNEVAKETDLRDEKTTKLSNKWKDRELGEDDTQSEFIRDEGGWEIIGASRIGKLHIQNDGHREDSFKIAIKNGWYIAAVADGGGSYKYSRDGSRIAVNASVDFLIDQIEKTSSESQNNSWLKYKLEHAVAMASNAIDQEAMSRKSLMPEISRKDFSTTLLLVSFHSEKQMLGYAQIGDGFIGAQFIEDKIVSIGNPESGQYASETNFLTRESVRDLVKQVGCVLEPTNDLLSLILTTDGISDDFYPAEKNMINFTNVVFNHIFQPEPEKKLLDIIDYSKAGSFDDRTVVLIYNREKLLRQKPQK